MKKKLRFAFCCLLFALCLLPFSSSAQQVEEFSLLRENAFVLNPALAGMNGWLHGVATFRKQFTNIDRSPYTALLAMDGELLGKNLGLGGYLIQDVTGPTGKSGITISAAYHFKLFKKYGSRYSNGASDHNLSIGISLSAVQYRLRGDLLQLTDLNDPGLYTSKGSTIFPDASFGIYYKYRKSFYAGLSMPQIMGLNVNYRGTDGLAQIRKVQHINLLVGGKIEMARGNFALEPVAAFRWVNGAPPQGDIGLRFDMYKFFWIGANYRSINYMVMEAGLNIKNIFTFSYTYDMNISKYRNDIGATHELTAAFKIEKSKYSGRNGIGSPRF